MIVNKLLFSFLLFCGLLSATELYDWHSLDISMPISSKLDLTVHTRTRVRHEFTYLDQVRAGTILKYKTPKVNLSSGYYYQPQQISKGVWTEGFRLFLGAEKKINTLSLRASAERHINTGRPNYNRYRTYERYTFKNSRVAPFVQNEWLFVNSGFHSVRNSGGLTFKLYETITSTTSLDVGYLYDIRRTFWGGDRQALVTSLHYRIK